MTLLAASRKPCFLACLQRSRLKHPELIHASVASSAPVFATFDMSGVPRGCQGFSQVLQRFAHISEVEEYLGYLLLKKGVIIHLLSMEKISEHVSLRVYTNYPVLWVLK